LFLLAVNKSGDERRKELQVVAPVAVATRSLEPCRA
jgi:hypothetical protein